MAAADGASRKLSDAPWLGSGPLRHLLGVLDRDGEEARVVGGAVRNALLGMTAEEIDVATTAVPDEVVRRVEAAGFKAVPTGIAHGTITVVVDKMPFEVTTLRQDVETYGRHAKVAFGRDWRTDAERRDFTVNAFSVRADGTVYDYVGGLEDLAARRVRFIGDPRLRIEEDYLRILRFFRFHAAYGTSDHPDRAGLAACIAGRNGLEQLSRERVRMELLKLVVAPHAVPTLIAMTDASLTLRVLGGVSYLASFEMMAKVEAAIGISPIRCGGWARLRVLGGGGRRAAVAEAAADQCRARAAGLDGRGLAADFAGMASRPRARCSTGSARSISPTMCCWPGRVRACAAIDAAWHELATLPQRWTAPAFPLKAADFMARGVEKGPALGVAMAKAEQAWIEAGFPDDAAALAKIAEAVAKTA